MNGNGRRDLRTYPVVGPDRKPEEVYIDKGTPGHPDIKKVRLVFDGRFFKGELIEQKDEHFVPDQLQQEQNQDAARAHRARMAAMVDQA